MREDFIYPNIELDVPLDEDMLDSLGENLPKTQVEEYVREQVKSVRKEKLWKYAYDNFKVDGKPWEMSPSEYYIYRMIVLREYPRCQFCTSTQIGKTLTASRGILTRITTYPEDYLVVAPDAKRGRIFIKYIIEATSENQYFEQKLTGLNLGSEKDRGLIMRLLAEKSKVKLTYSVLDPETDKVKLGSIEIITASAKFKQQALDSIMGFGGRNIISEESALIGDEIEAGIFRMIAGKGSDVFYLKIGNPFYRNHFLESWKNPKYKKVYVCDYIGLAEKRYTQDFIDEAKGKPRYSVLFGGSFPPKDSVDEEGWMMLMTREEIKLAMQGGVHFGEERMGADPADQGINESVAVKRSTGYAEILFAEDKVDPMDFVGHVVNNISLINSMKLYWDRVGVGSGGYFRLREVNRTMKDNKMVITGVNAGEKTMDPNFFNKRAEMYWNARKWIKEGGKLSKDERWYQLSKIPYKPDSSGKIQIMPKEQMRKRDIASPDAGDSLAMTFYDPPAGAVMSQEDKFFVKKMHEKRKKGKKGYHVTGISR